MASIMYITVLCIPINANKTVASEYMNNLCNDLANEKPDSLQIVLGDMNRCKLQLPNFTQYVTCNTRKDASLDAFHCNTKDAYRSIQEPPLKNSDHNVIHKQSIYRRKTCQRKT